MIIIPRYIQQVQAAGKKAKSGVPTATITTTKVGTFSMTLRGYAGSLTVDWGDGSALQVVTLLGISTDVVVNHTYVLAGGKVISISDYIVNVTKLAAITQSIINVELSNLLYLDYLQLNNNYDLASVSSLSKLTNLSEVRLYSTQVNDLSPLINSSGHLVLLFTHNTLITDLSPVVNFSNLSNFWVYGNPIEYPLAGLAWPVYSSGTFRLNSTVSTSAEVDRMLIDFAAAGWNNLTLYLDGTNPARTSASDAAVATLAANNVILYLTP